MLRGKEPRFQLLPYKILLLSVINAVYKGHHKTFDSRLSTSEVLSQKQQRERNFLSLLKLLGHVSEGLPLALVYKYLEERDKCKPRLLPSVMRTVSTLISNGTEGLTELVIDCECTILLEETNGSVPVGRNSIIGLFLRTIILAFHKLTFSEKVKCVKDFCVYHSADLKKDVKLDKTPTTLGPILEKINSGYLSLALKNAHSTFDKLQGESTNSKLPDKMGQALLVLAKIYEEFGLTQELGHSAREALISGQDLHTNSVIEEAKKLLLLNGILSPKQLLQLRPGSFHHDKSGVFSLITQLLNEYKNKAKLVSILSGSKDRKHTADSRMLISKLWDSSHQLVVASLVESLLHIIPSGRKELHKNASKYGRCQMLLKVLGMSPKNGSGKAGFVEDEALQAIAGAKQLLTEGHFTESLKVAEDIAAILPNHGHVLQAENRERFGFLEVGMILEKDRNHQVGLLSDKVSNLDSDNLLAKHSLLCGNYGNAMWRIASHSTEIIRSSDISKVLTLPKAINSFGLPTISLQFLKLCKSIPWLSATDEADLAFEESSIRLASLTSESQLSLEGLSEVIHLLETCAAVYEGARLVFKLKEVYFTLAVVYEILDCPEERNSAAKRFRDVDELHGNMDFAYAY